MIICSCNVLTDDDIRGAVVDAGVPVLTSGEVYSGLGCSPQCGRCSRSIKRIMRDALACCSAGCPWSDPAGR